VITGCPQCSQLLGCPHVTHVFFSQYLFWHLTLTFSPVLGTSFSVLGRRCRFRWGSYLKSESSCSMPEGTSYKGPEGLPTNIV
jgi:hypothetical protein